MRRALWLLCSICISGCASSVTEGQPGVIDRIFGSPSQTITADTAPVTPAAGSVADAALATTSDTALAVASDYKLGAGDRIMVTVFNEKELTVDTRLSDAGTLSFPLLGEIRALGMTIGKLQDELTSQLKNGFLVNPQVYVSILEYRQFFVNGEVNKPGGLPFQPGLTIRKAVALAGGFTMRASRSKIFIIREDDDLGRPRQASLDTVLRPGDIVTVEQSFF